MSKVMKRLNEIVEAWKEKPDKVPKDDLELLETTFEAVEFDRPDLIPKGVEITPEGVKLPNGRVYKCLPYGWKRVR